ncbi:MAG: hypothetical protein ACRC1K_02800 [Planctomycetia bacterium]
MRAGDIIHLAVGRYGVLLAQAAGFERQALTFHRTLPQMTQIIFFEVDRDATYHRADFHIEVGLTFTTARTLVNGDPDEPRRTTYDFLQPVAALIDGAPDRWSVEATTSPEMLADEVSPLLLQLLVDLEAVSSPEVLLNHRWGRLGGPETETLLRYETGDFCGAWRALEQLGDEAAVMEFIGSRRLDALRPFADPSAVDRSR